METREALELMLQVLQEKEWVQGKLWTGATTSATAVEELLLTPDQVTGVCLEGAWSLCTGVENLDDWIPVRDALLGVIRDLYPDRLNLLLGMDLLYPQPAPHLFNDHEDTTKEDVLLVIKTAIGRCA